jgi:hypothetical protein
MQRRHSIDVQCQSGNDGVKEKKELQMRLLTVLLALGIIGACTPTVKIEAPDKPIVINLNVKIDQEVRLTLDAPVEDLITSNPDLF